MNSIPAGPMGLPWTKAHPAKLRSTRVVPANHVITATIFFNCCMTFWTLLQTAYKLCVLTSCTIFTHLSINMDPIRSLTIIIALHLP